MAITDTTAQNTRHVVGSFASGFRTAMQPKFRPDDSPDGLWRRFRLAVNRRDRSQAESLFELLFPPDPPAAPAN